MEIKKRTPYLCPECGEADDIESLDHEFDDTSMRVDCVCEKCNTSWSEYFELRYNGYAYNGVDYEADGEEMFS